MNNIAQGLTNPYVLFYCASVVLAQLFYSQWRRQRRSITKTQRRTRGLPSDILLNQPEQLIVRRQQAVVESLLLLITAVGLPLVLWIAIPLVESSAAATANSRLGLTIAVVGVVSILLWSAKQPLQAFVGGLAFKLLAVFTMPFEVGDPIVVKGLTGKVVHLGTFLLALETTDGKQISLPTYLLWNETIAIAPERAAQCETILQLPLCTSQQQRRLLAIFLREVVQSSTYVAPAKAVQIYFSIVSQRLHITVVAYVAAEEHTMAFKSDIASAFLSFAERENIDLIGKQSTRIAS